MLKEMLLSLPFINKHYTLANKKPIIMKPFYLKFFGSLICFLSITFNCFSQKDGESIKKNTEGIIIEKGAYKNKKQTGVWNYYFLDGTPSLTANYKNGVLNGESIRYDLQGNMIAQLSYLDGKITGHQIYYYPNGLKMSEGEMINGKEEGAWRYYRIDGEPMGIVKYKNGAQIDEKSKKSD